MASRSAFDSRKDAFYGSPTTPMAGEPAGTRFCGVARRNGRSILLRCPTGSRRGLSSYTSRLAGAGDGRRGRAGRRSLGRYQRFSAFSSMRMKWPPLLSQHGQIPHLGSLATTCNVIYTVQQKQQFVTRMGSKTGRNGGRPPWKSKRRSPGKTKHLSVKHRRPFRRPSDNTTCRDDPKTPRNDMRATSFPPRQPRPRPHAPAAVKLSRLPSDNPNTRHSPMNPPAASLSPSSTHSPAAIMQLDPSQPFVSPNSSCTTKR